MSRIAVFAVLAVAIILALSSIRIIGRDEVALVGDDGDVRELGSGFNLVIPFSEIRRYALFQKHVFAEDEALLVKPGGLKAVHVDCEVGISLDRERIKPLDRDYGDTWLDKLIRPLLLREIGAALSGAADLTAVDLEAAGQAIARSINQTTEPLGISVQSVHLGNVREQARVAHDLKRAEGVRVFVLGLDGYDWLILNEILEAKELANIERIRREGAWGNLRSIEPLVSPLIWTTMVTGVTPDIHGITDFLVRDPVSGEDIPVTSSMRKVPALWNITSLFDLECGFVGWFASYPAEEIQGFIVSDRFAYHMFDPGWRKGKKEPARSGITYPPELYDDIAGLSVKPEDVGDRMARYLRGPAKLFKTDDSGLLYWDSQRRDDPEDGLRLIISAYRTYESVMKQLYPVMKPDLFGIYFEFTDSVCHLFMKYMDPPMAGTLADDTKRYGDAIAGTYAEADRVIGDVLDMLDDTTVLMIVSDHGFKSGDMRPLTDSRMGYGQAVEWHRINGSIAMYGSIVKRGHKISDASVLDIAPTILYLLGLPVDRKMSGKVLVDAFDKTWVERHPVTYTSKYDSLIVGQETTVGPSAGDEALKEKLISLGYVAGGSSALVNLASYYHKNGQYEKALEVWKELVELEPDNLGARIGLSNAYYELGRHEVAIRSLNEVLAIDPNHMEALHSLVTIHIEQGRPGEALSVAERAIRADSNDGKSHFDKGMALELMGRRDEAAQSYRKAIGLAPDLAEAYANLAQIYATGGRSTEALELAQKAIELASGKPEIHYVMGMALETNGRPDEALGQYLTALRLDSTLVPAYIGASGVLLAQGKTDSVIILCSQALKISSPYKSYVHNMKASAHMSRGELDVATRELKSAIQIDPGNASARMNLARIYAQTGRRSEAVSELETILRTYPNHAEARSLLRTLQ